MNKEQVMWNDHQVITLLLVFIYTLCQEVKFTECIPRGISPL